MTATRATRAKGMPKADVPRAFWSVNEFATITGLAQDTVYRMIRASKLGAVRLGGEWRIPNQEVERLTAEAMQRVAS